MKFRTMRFKEGEDRVSMLGMGTMRFPQTEDGAIDEPKAEEMVDRALKAGVNYIDTAYPYHSGASEPFMGRVLRKYPRDSFYLATKLPVWLVETPEDAARLFKEQLQRLQVKYFDYYLLHALDKGRWNKLVKNGIVEWAEALKASGKIRHLGFSFHDDYETFREILTYRQWDFCQIQYNYMDRDEQAGDRGYVLAEKMGIPMVIMEPVKGGRLAGLSAEAESTLKAVNPEASMASWALRWTGSHKNAKVILSGMSSMEQLEDNISTFENFKELDEEEQKALLEAAEQLKSRVKNGCTACRYCMPCPFGVDIPGNFGIWNNCAIYDETERAKKSYKEKQAAKQSADLCQKCGKCEAVCPQKISIRRDLAAVAKELGEEAEAAKAEASKAEAAKTEASKKEAPEAETPEA